MRNIEQEIIAPELINKIEKKIGGKKAKIFLQIPEGLKYKIISIIDKLSECGYEIVLSGEPCYGACDIRDKEAEMLGCDLILHIGHKKFYKKFKTAIPVIYFPFELKVKYNKEELKKIPYKRIGLISTVNHASTLNNIYDDLRRIGKEPLIGGEILGCWTENAKKIEKKADCILFVGSGKFHMLGIETEKPLYYFDLEKNEIRNENIKRKKIFQWRLEKLRNASSVGVLISTKPGQFYSNYKEVENKLKRMGKRVYILVMDRIADEKLLGMDIDCFINTACPRIVEDRFEKPVINVNDFVNYF
ncbi:MAG: diphthamide biosynthesis enzyme Dph2 [Candidatus Aenigmatarchaeota archaeon]